jgi:hypothetical protein
MAWTDSRIFRIYVSDMIDNTLAHDYVADSIKAALYNNTTAPDNDVAQATSAYNTGQWVVGNEVSEAVTWPAGGVALGTKAINVSVADTVYTTAANTASSAGADLAAVYGCLVYDDTLTPKAGLCYNYFGGSNSVTNGTFTIVWHANGVFRFTL